MIAAVLLVVRFTRQDRERRGSIVDSLAPLPLLAAMGSTGQCPGSPPRGEIGGARTAVALNAGPSLLSIGNLTKNYLCEAAVGMDAMLCKVCG